MHYHNLIDELLFRMLRTVGVEYHMIWNETAHWSFKREGPTTWIWMGKIELIVLKVKRKAAITTTC